MELNPDISQDFYGVKVTVKKKRSSMSKPDPANFGLPKSEEEFNLMMSKMFECGFNKARATEIMKERKEKYLKAKQDFENQPENNQSWN